MLQRYIYIISLLLLLFLPGRVAAQQYRESALSLDVYFPMNYASIEYRFEGNGARIRKFVKEWKALKGKGEVKEIVVTGSVSPEGPAAFNQDLAQRRAHNLGRYLSYLMGVDESHFRYDIQDNTGATIVEDQWKEYRHAGILKVAMAAREDASQGTDSEGLSSSQQNQSLQSEGQSGNLAGLTAGAATGVTAAAAGVTAGALTTDTPADGAATSENTQNTTREKFWPIVLRTNLILPALNIGIEVPLGNRWSVGADWYYPWLWRKKHSEGVDYSGWCAEALALNIEGRYWFGKRSYERRLLGHSAGLFAMAGYYDFERNYKGLQGEFATVGLDYLFAMPVFKNRMHLEFSLGIGYFYSQAREYEVYEVGGKGYKVKDMTKVIQYFGPVKATVSLVLPIYFTKKGGDK